MLDGWKTTIGSVLAAISAAMYTINLETDKPLIIAAKLIGAVALGLLGIGIAAKADKLIAATAKPTELIAATPAARAEIAAAEAAKPAAPPALTDAQKIAAYDALHPKIGV